MPLFDELVVAVNYDTVSPNTTMQHIKRHLKVALVLLLMSVSWDTAQASAMVRNLSLDYRPSMCHGGPHPTPSSA